MTPTLVFGATGFLGKTFCSQASAAWIPVDRHQYDLSQPLSREFERFLENTPARAAVVAAAMSGPDDCLREPELSERVNVEGMIELFQALQRFRIKPVFISSDHVFNGLKGLFREDEVYAPVTLYGRQKVKAETHLREHHQNYLILRTSKQLALRVDRKNMLSEMATKVLAGEEIRCATDSWLTPAFVEDIVAMTAKALEAGLNGVYHVAPPGEISRYELGLQIAEVFAAPPHLVRSCSMRDFGFPEVRPPRCTLDGSRLRSKLNFRMIDTRQGLNELKNTLKGANFL